MKKIIHHLLISIFTSVLMFSAAAAQTVPSPGPDYVWEQGYALEDGSVVEGFWRKADEPGYQWVEAMWLEDGTFVEPHGEPIEDSDSSKVWEHGFRNDDGVYYRGYWRDAARDGFVWVPGHYENGAYVWGRWYPVEAGPTDYVYTEGHVGPDGYWVNGFWRPHAMVGYEWVDGYWHSGGYYWGYWRPLVPRHGYVWVPGHIGMGGTYVMGFWRPSAYVGFTWTDGYYVQGGWYWGCWAPMTVAVGMVWTPGYVSNGYWVAGYWRPGHKHGHSWVDGYYAGNVYHKGYWAKGTTVSYPKGATVVHYAGAGQGYASAKPKVQYAAGKAPKGYKPVRYADAPKDSKSLAALGRRHTTYNQHKALYESALNRRHETYNSAKSGNSGGNRNDNGQSASERSEMSARAQAHSDYNSAAARSGAGNANRGEIDNNGRNLGNEDRRGGNGGNAGNRADAGRASTRQGDSARGSNDNARNNMSGNSSGGSTRVQPLPYQRGNTKSGQIGRGGGNQQPSVRSASPRVQSTEPGTIVRPSQTSVPERNYRASTPSPSPKYNRPQASPRQSFSAPTSGSSGRPSGTAPTFQSGARRPSSYSVPQSGSRSGSMKSAPRSGGGSRGASSGSRGGRPRGR